MKYKVVIKDANLDHILDSDGEMLYDVTQMSIIGKEKEYVKIKFSNSEDISLMKEQVEIVYV